MRDDGKTWDDIAQAIGRSESQVRRYLKRQAPVEVPPKEMAAMRESAMESRIAQLEQQLADAATKPKADTDRLPVETNAEKPVSVADLWRHGEAENRKRIEFTRERSKFKLSMPNEPIGVCFISDQHVSVGNTVDLERMRLDAELISQTPGLYAMLGGDGIDGHIKIRPAMLAARSQPAEQWELFEYYLSIFADKIIVLTAGNHDLWTDQIAGVDMLARIARSQRICYAPHEARVEVNVGGVPYKLAVRHSYRFNSSYNQTHSVQQWWRFGEADYDIGCICHHHEAAVTTFTAHGLLRWACRPGAYQISSSHSNQWGYNSTYPTCPTFILFPGARRIIGFHDVRDGVLLLNALRGTSDRKQ